MSDKPQFKLKPTLGLSTIIALIGTTIIGSGIFMTPGSILSEVGSIGAFFINWVVCAFIAMCCGLSYLELSLLVQESGGEYAFSLRAYNDYYAFLVICGKMIITKPGALLLNVYTFSEYFLALLRPAPCSASDGEKKILAGVVLLIAMLINILSVKLSNAITNVFFYIKVLVLLVIVVTGLVKLGQGNGTENFSDPFSGTSSDWTAYSVALYSGMWSFDGWNQLAYVTEEAKNPAKIYPIAIFTAIPLVAVLYILANVAYLTVLTPTEIMNGSAVAVTFAYRTLGGFAWIVPVGVVCSTFGTTCANLFGSGRMANVASRRGHLPLVLSYVDVVRFTPSLAIMFNCLMAIIFLIPDSSSFSTILDYFSFTTWIFYGTSCFAVVVLRFKKPYSNLKRPYKVWIGLPIFASVISAYLVLAPIIQEPKLGYLYVVILLLSGSIFYVPIHVFKVTWIDGVMGWVTLKLQRILQLAPAEVSFGRKEK